MGCSQVTFDLDLEISGLKVRVKTVQGEVEGDSDSNASQEIGRFGRAFPHS